MDEREIKQRRIDEYKELRAELEAPEALPEALDQRVAAALHKGRKHRRRHIFALPAGGFAAVLCSFVIMVNSSFGFALAMGNIPVVGAVARAVALSPSLKAALAHDYVQVIGETQEVNGIRMTVQYLIADQKQISIFYSVEGAGASQYFGDLRVAREEEHGLQYTSLGTLPEKGELGLLTFQFENAIPEQLHFVYTLNEQVELGAERVAGLESESRTLPVTEDEEYELVKLPWYATDETGEVATPLEQDRKGETVQDRIPTTREVTVAAFDYSLEIDPRFVNTGEVVEIGAWVTLDGQRIYFSDMEIYPTHVRVNVETDETNTALLKGLKLSLQTDGEDPIAGIENGISATGDENGEMVTFHINSNYFSSAQEFSLLISGAEWLGKESPKTVIDLGTRTADYLPDGVVLDKILRDKDGDWQLYFQAESDAGVMYGLFQSRYEDLDGDLYDMNGWSSTYINDTTFQTVYQVKVGADDKVVLFPSYSERLTYAEPVVLEVTR